MGAVFEWLLGGIGLCLGCFGLVFKCWSRRGMAPAQVERNPAQADVDVFDVGCLSWATCVPEQARAQHDVDTLHEKRLSPIRLPLSIMLVSSKCSIYARQGTISAGCWCPL